MQPCGHLLGKDLPLGSLVCVVFLCVFVTFSYGFLGQVWYLILSIPDLCFFLTLKFYNIGLFVTIFIQRLGHGHFSIDI